MPDQQVREIDPIFSRHNFHKRALDRLRRGGARETHAAGKPRDVSINNNTFSNAEGRAENDIGGLAPNAIELKQFSHCTRDAPAVFLSDRSTTIADGARLVPKKTGGADHLLEFAGCTGRKIGRGTVAGEQGRSNLVDPFVGALGAEDCSYQKLKRVVMMQRTAEIGIRSAETSKDNANTSAYFGLGNIHYK